MVVDNNPKAIAGQYAADLVADNMIVGLGTGSTAIFAIKRLGERISQGLQITGIPTSEASAKLATECNIPLVSLKSITAIDITIDGADEIDENFHMVKGGGGALLREKVVASITRRQICIVDPTKLVESLGRFPLPVEVVPFGWQVVTRRIAHLGGTATLRQTQDNNSTTFITDNGNYILDCDFYPITDAPLLEHRLKMLPGVVEVGLFINLAHTLVIGNVDGSCVVRERDR